MITYLINLDERQDRLKFIEYQTKKIGLNYERVTAFPKYSFEVQSIAHTSNLGNSEIACLLSHQYCWMQFLKSTHSLCMILEDDVIISHTIPSVINHIRSAPFYTFNIKLETIDRRVTIAKNSLFKTSDFSFHKIMSRNDGSAAYMIDRSAANHLIKENDWSIAADGYLFNPRSPGFLNNTLQTVPGVCIQGKKIDSINKLPVYRSDIARVKISTPLKRRVTRAVENYTLKNIIYGKRSRVKFVGLFDVPKLSNLDLNE